MANEPVNLRINLRATFPVQVEGAAGIGVSKQNGIYTIANEYPSLAEIGSIPIPAQKAVVVYDLTTGVYNLVPTSALPGAAGGAGSGNVTGPSVSVDGDIALFSGTTGTLLKDGGKLGTAAVLNAGISAGNVVQLDGSARLPAVDGSQLTHLPVGGNVSGPASSTDGHVALFSGATGKIIQDGGALGGAAFLPVGTGNGSVAAGNDSRITGALQSANNLSELTSTAATARMNLGLGTAATRNTGIAANQVVLLDSSARLPAVDGSQLINLPTTGGGIPEAPTDGQQYGRQSGGWTPITDPDTSGGVNVINVLAYGADPRGQRDSTSAIQAAMDAAWGPVENPHGTAGPGHPELNVPLYLPAGRYSVSSAFGKVAIISISDNGSGYIRVTVPDTSNLKAGWIVFISGVTSSAYPGVFGPTQYINSPRGIRAIVNATQFDLSLTEIGVDAGGVASFTGTIAGTALTTSNVLGPLGPGMVVVGPGVLPGTQIVSGAAPNWQVNNSHVPTVGPEAMQASSLPWGVSWSNVFDPGTGVVQTACLHARAVRGPVMFGDGMSVTSIGSSDGSAVMSVNGFAVGVVRDLSMSAGSGAYCTFDYNWTDRDEIPQTQSSQNMLFMNVECGIIERTGVAMLVGWGGRQTDTSMWVNCNFGGNGQDGGKGLYFGNQNSIGHTIIGGNWQAFFNYAIDTGVGQIGSVIGATFTSNAGFSMRLAVAGNNSTFVSGCSSEDKNFIFSQGGLGLVINGCEHRGANGGSFLDYEGSDPTVECGCCTIIGGWSAGGIIGQCNGNLNIIGTNFKLGMQAALANLTTSVLGARVLQCDVAPLPFALLPVPTPYLTGLVMRCSDSPIAFAPGNYAAAVTVGGGTNEVSVRCDGATWRLA